jgi:hypothetical protein
MTLRKTEHVVCLTTVHTEDGHPQHPPKGQESGARRVLFTKATRR